MRNIYISKYCTSIILIIFVKFNTSLAQNFSGYKFIEPNVSISYDTNEYKISNRYSNTTYETEAYDIVLLKYPENISAIFIEAKNPGIPPSREVLNTSLLEGIENVKNDNDDSFHIVRYDTTVRIINNFSCVAFTGYNKFTDTITTYISCYNFSRNDNTQIKYFSKSGNTLDKDYSLLTPLLMGYRNYSKEEISKEDKFIKNKYSISVFNTSKSNYNLSDRNKAYLGVVKVEQKLEHTIKEVRIENDLGKEIFYPEEDGSTIIICNDKQKGEITKYGEMVIFNSFGKNVIIPFSFTYFSK